MNFYVFCSQLVEGHQQHFDLGVLGLAHVQNYLLQLLFLSLQRLSLLQFFLQLQVLSLQLPMSCP